MVVNFIPLQVHPYLKEENQQYHFTQHGSEFLPLQVQEENQQYHFTQHGSEFHSSSSTSISERRKPTISLHSAW